MSLKQVPQYLYKETQTAADNIYEYDRLERYVINQVLTAAKQNVPIDEVFIKCAKTALKRHPYISKPN
jgi:hypothetical protein